MLICLINRTFFTITVKLVFLQQIRLNQHVILIKYKDNSSINKNTSVNYVKVFGNKKKKFFSYGIYYSFQRRVPTLSYLMSLFNKLLLASNFILSKAKSKLEFIDYWFLFSKTFFHTSINGNWNLLFTITSLTWISNNF
jgi:hypothetical protein